MVTDRTNFNQRRDNFLDLILFSHYDCSNFAKDLKLNALKQEIRCIGVIVRFHNGLGHCLVAFQTTDRGVIFIEPQTDQEVMIANSFGYRYSGYVISEIHMFWPEIKNKIKN